MTSLALLGMFIYVILFCSVFYAFRSYISHLKFNSKKNDIALLQAKIMALRMALRVRVKGKLSTFRERFGKLIDSNLEIDRVLNELSSAKYESGEDFQRYFELSQEIILLMSQDSRFSSKLKEIFEQKDQVDQTTESSKLFQGFCGIDSKNEIALVRLIKEITDTHNKLSKKITEFNLEYKDKKKFAPLQSVQIIQFDFLADINAVFKNSDILLQDLEKKRSDFFSSAA